MIAQRPVAPPKRKPRQYQENTIRKTETNPPPSPQPRATPHKNQSQPQISREPLQAAPKIFRKLTGKTP